MLDDEVRVRVRARIGRRLRTWETTLAEFLALGVGQRLKIRGCVLRGAAYQSADFIVEPIRRRPGERGDDHVRRDHLGDLGHKLRREGRAGLVRS